MRLCGLARTLTRGFGGGRAEAQTAAPQREKEPVVGQGVRPGAGMHGRPCAWGGGFRLGC